MTDREKRRKHQQARDTLFAPLRQEFNFDVLMARHAAVPDVPAVPEVSEEAVEAVLASLSSPLDSEAAVAAES